MSCEWNVVYNDYLYLTFSWYTVIRESLTHTPGIILEIEFQERTHNRTEAISQLKTCNERLAIECILNACKKMFGFLTTRLCHCQRRFEYQQLPLHCLFIILFSDYCPFMTNLYHAIDKSLVLPRILLSFREVEAFIRGCNRGMLCTGSELEKWIFEDESWPGWRCGSLGYARNGFLFFVLTSRVTKTEDGFRVFVPSLRLHSFFLRTFTTTLHERVRSQLGSWGRGVPVQRISTAWNENHSAHAKR